MENTVLITVIVTPVIAFFLKVLYQEYLFFRNKNERPTTVLKKHELLNSYFDNRLNFINNIWNISDKGRQTVVRIAMTAYLEIWREHLLELAKEVDESHKREKECADLYQINMKAFNTSIEEYTHFYQNNNFSKEENEIFEIFMDKFQSYHLSNIKSIEGFVFRICMNKLITNCVEIQYMIFSNYLSAFDITFMDMNDTVSKLNGELTGKIINDIKIGELKEVY